MAIAAGGGRYEKQCLALHKETGGDVVMVLVGHREKEKSGFSCAMTHKGIAQMSAIIHVLREAAQQFEDEFFPDPSTTQGQDATNESDSNKEG